ncbi:MAG: rod-binding protein [Thermogutta sp.]
MSILGIHAASGLYRTSPLVPSSRVDNGHTSQTAFAALLSSAAYAGGVPSALVAQSSQPNESAKSEAATNATNSATVGQEGAGLSSATDDEEVEKVFQTFVGRTFFGLMLKEMRKSIHKTPYFHGGLAEEVFEQHLDMTLAEKLAESSGEQFPKPMYKLFRLQARR